MPRSHLVYFAIPGNLAALTGGYAYDRRVIVGLRALGLEVEYLPLSGEFPHPGSATLSATARLFASLPDGAIVIADGLAFGVMNDIAEREKERLRIIALCHHPLALETGLTATQVASLRMSETRALAAARAVIVTSAATADLLVREFGITPEKIFLAPPGVTVRPRISVKRSEINAPIPTLLTLATLTRRKGHDVLLKALAQIRHLSWHARFVGSAEFDPQWADELCAEARSLEMASRIDFVGAVTDPSQELMHADLFVLPSRFEGYGMAFAEALAFGLPVVGARAGAVPDLVGKDAGILVPPDDHQALAAALERLLTDPALRRQLQKGAQKAALTLPTWEQSVSKIAGLIAQL